MEVETCGESWKVVKSFLIFIYTRVISLSLASKPKYAENRTTIPNMELHRFTGKHCGLPVLVHDTLEYGC